MDADQTPVARALYKILRPLVRLLMRQGVSYRQFADVARHVYVDVAEEDFALPGRKPSKSRTAVLTGINRKDIAKLKDRPHPLSDGASEAATPAARLIEGWINDATFHNADGVPLALPMERCDRGDVSFSELAKRYTTDVPLRALLDELTRIGAVQVDGDVVRLVTAAYVPYADVRENIRIFATAAADLFTTIDHNIAGNPPGRFIQRTVSYDTIPQELLVSIRERSRTEGEAFLLQVNEWLAQSGGALQVDSNSQSKARAGIGLYYFEHLLEDDKERLK